MVRLIMGANGAGKTKQLIELIHNSVESETGSVVCIEPSRDMTYDISYNVRLVNAGEYNVDSFECLRGFLCGLSGYLLDVNPFDQPGVEAYKQNMFALLGKPGYEELRQTLLKKLKR